MEAGMAGAAGTAGAALEGVDLEEAADLVLAPVEVAEDTARAAAGRAVEVDVTVAEVAQGQVPAMQAWALRAAEARRVTAVGPADQP
jgi:hypothetical protein